MKLSRAVSPMFFALFVGCATPADHARSLETTASTTGAGDAHAVNKGEPPKTSADPTGPLSFHDAMEQMEGTGIEDDVLLPPDLEDNAPAEFLNVIEQADDLLRRATPDPKKVSPEFERLLTAARQGSRGLVAAARAGNLDAFHDARDTLYQTCIDCHDRFRNEDEEGQPGGDGN